MKAPKAPAAPDFAKLAQQQADLTNKATKFDTFNPYGSNTWEQAADGRWTNRTNLDPNQRYLFDQGQSAQKTIASRSPQYAQMVADYLANPLDSGAQVRDRVEAELLGRLNTQSDRDLEQTRSRLLNQGITENSEAWRRAMSDFDMNRQNARTAAIINAGQEASRQVSLDSGLRNQYLGELASILGQSAPMVPQFAAPTAAAAPDIYGAAQDQYAAALQDFNAKVARQGQIMNAVGQTGATAAMAFGG